MDDSIPNTEGQRDSELEQLTNQRTTRPTNERTKERSTTIISMLLSLLAQLGAFLYQCWLFVNGPNMWGLYLVLVIAVCYRLFERWAMQDYWQDAIDAKYGIQRTPKDEPHTPAGVQQQSVYAYRARRKDTDAYE